MNCGYKVMKSSQLEASNTRSEASFTNRVNFIPSIIMCGKKLLINSQTFGMDKQFHLTLYRACGYLPILGIKVKPCKQKRPLVFDFIFHWCGQMFEKGVDYYICWCCAAWWPQAITWTNVYLSLVRCSGNHPPLQMLIYHQWGVVAITHPEGTFT